MQIEHYVLLLQVILLPIQGLLFIATRREKEETAFMIKEGLKQALRVIVSRR